MKKLILIVTLAAFACSPMLQTQAQAAQGKHKQATTAKSKHQNHRHPKHKARKK